MSLCKKLRQISSKPVLFALITADVLILLVLFPALGGDSNVAPLDIRFWYDTNTAYSVFAALGPDGRLQYMLGASTLDVVYPFVYSTMFAVWLTLLLPGENRLSCAVRLSPFAILLADLLENSGIIIMLSRFPEKMDSLVFVTALLTASKWSLASAVIMTTLILSMRAGYMKYRHS